MTFGEGTMRSSRGRRGLGRMWKIHFRGPSAYSVDPRLFFCQQPENHLTPLLIHVLLFSQEPSQKKRKIWILNEALHD